MKAEEVRDILNHKDVLLAITRMRAKNQAEIDQLQTKMVEAFKTAVAPPSRPTNAVGFALGAVRNIFQIWQGVSFGLRVVRGFRSAFKKR